jgi:hypothetical protein
MFSYSPETVCEVHPGIVGTKYKGERQPYHELESVKGWTVIVKKMAKLTRYLRGEEEGLDWE